jgi:hypothetical protein
MCDAAGDGTHEQNIWIGQFGPSIVERLNKEVPGAGVKASNIYSLMSVCAIETQVLEKKSPWCDVFSEDNWIAFEYAADVEKFYKTGCVRSLSYRCISSSHVCDSYGEPLGPVQGVGWVNELLARLTESPVQDHTQTNHTLDSSPETFPLDRAIYVDFTHENSQVAILAALGAFNDGRPLDPLRPDPARIWNAARMVPFSARLVIERFACGKTKRIRMLLNDELVELECAQGSLDGTCSLEAFVKSQAYARSDGAGDWQKCFE